jgi:hypothetical protein
MNKSLASIYINTTELEKNNNTISTNNQEHKPEENQV